jgi:type IV pilus assembly protein PilA
VYRVIHIGIVCAGAVLLPMMLWTPRIGAPRETGAVKAITTIHTAQVQYFSNYGRYAASMQELGPPASGADGPSAANLIERDLASGEKGGYKFTLTPTATGYTISVVPSQFGTSGDKTYFSDPDMRIHAHSGPEPATANDPVMGEPVQRQ